MVQNMGALSWVRGMADPQNTPFPRGLAYWIWTEHTTDICRKIGTLTSRLIRSLRVTDSGTDRSGIYDFLLVTNYRTASEIYGHFCPPPKKHKYFIRL